MLADLAASSRPEVRRPQSARLARSLATQLTVTLVLIGLLGSFAVAASFPNWRREQADYLRGRLANLNERAELTDFNEKVVNDEIEADDEEFLRHLKAAARYLDERLESDRQRPISVEFAAGNEEAPLARYGLLVEQPARAPTVDSAPSERFHYALPPARPAAADDELPLAGGADLEVDKQQTSEQTNLKASLLNYLLALDGAARVDQEPAPAIELTAPERQTAAAAAADDQLQQSLAKRRHEQPAPKVSTLLEDETPEVARDATPPSSPTPQVSQVTSTSTSAPPVDTTVWSNRVESQQPQSQPLQQPSYQAPKSLLESIYDFVCYYFPFLKRQNGSSSSSSAGTSSGWSSWSGETKAYTKQEPELERQKSEPTSLVDAQETPKLAQNDKLTKEPEEEKKKDFEDGLQSAKQSVSTTSKTIKAEQEESDLEKSPTSPEVQSEQVLPLVQVTNGTRRVEIDLEPEGDQNQTVDKTKDKVEEEEEATTKEERDTQVKLEPSERAEREAASRQTPQGGGEPSLKLVASSKTHPSATKKRVSMQLAAAAAAGDEDEQEHQLDQMVAGQQQQAQPAAFNLMRQSNLALPHELAGSRADGGLLGRYIYAPTQHYYLGGAPSSSSLARHGQLEPDAQVDAAYEQLRPAYAYQGKSHPAASVFDLATLVNSNGGAGGGGLGSKAAPNDLYFLVMVGAFCVMAMAVVLAAGLFAYRVQQQRKTSLETDYPTYGVVGPNSMTGSCGGGVPGRKCGGYFNGHSAAGAKAGAKTSSAGAKQLADLYAAAAAIDSGLDKSSSTSAGSQHKKNSSSTISSAGGATANNADNSLRNSTGNSNSNNNNNGAPSAAGNQDAARMYHYQHQKHQMMISDRSSAGRHTSASDLDSDEENDDDGSYTVYECPGLASAHEMEIKNPLFNDDQSP